MAMIASMTEPMTPGGVPGFPPVSPDLLALGNIGNNRDDARFIRDLDQFNRAEARFCAPVLAQKMNFVVAN